MSPQIKNYSAVDFEYASLLIALAMPPLKNINNFLPKDSILLLKIKLVPFCHCILNLTTLLIEWS